LITDVRPIVERLLRKLVVAGLPLMAACQDDGPVVCEPSSIRCGSPSLCLEPDGSTSQSLPLTMGRATFTFDDGRLADYYRACAASKDSCGPDCRGFCLAAAGFSPATSTYYFTCDLTCGAPNQVQISYESAVCGRRPTGLQRQRCDRQTAPRADSPLGRLLAEAAELEAASVPAFAQLAADLAAHGAPEGLVRAARGAMADEARHWRRTRDVARRKGGAPVRPTFARRRAAPSSLEALAADNVVEGCIRETFGALVAARQAAMAVDREVAALMTAIANDEMNHAALAWRIDAWAAQRLGDSFRAPRSAAAHVALRELGAAARPLDPDLRAAAGLPDPAEAAALLTATWDALWKPAFSDPSVRA